MPKRHRLRRTRGYRKPAHVVVVTRPHSPYANRSGTLEEFQYWIEDQLTDDADFLAPLRGKDLACWCPLEVACHADILLHYANKKEG